MRRIQPLILTLLGLLLLPAVSFGQSDQSNLTFRLPKLNATSENCQFGDPVEIVREFPVTLRIGATFNPLFQFAGGVDVQIPALRLIPRFSTRLDAEVIINAGPARATTIPITFNQVFSNDIALGTGYYAGGGVGAYLGSHSRLGGKLFVGTEVFSKVGVEGTIHLVNGNKPFYTVQARIRF